MRNWLVIAALALILTPTAGSAPPAPRLWASVSANAMLLNGSHVVSVSRRDGAPAGVYEVFFDQDIDACAYLATPNSSSGPATAHIQAALTDVPNGVIVRMSNGATDVDNPFSVEVLCP